MRLSIAISLTRIERTFSDSMLRDQIEFESKSRHFSIDARGQRTSDASGEQRLDWKVQPDPGLRTRVSGFEKSTS
jgi:hypothetical protein